LPVTTADGGWEHQRITLSPDSDRPDFQPIVIDATVAAEGDLNVIAVAGLLVAACAQVYRSPDAIGAGPAALGVVELKDDWDGRVSVTHVDGHARGDHAPQRYELTPGPHGFGITYDVGNAILAMTLSFTAVAGATYEIVPGADSPEVRSAKVRLQLRDAASGTEVPAKVEHGRFSAK
jgi:hypothetical protein